MLPNIAPDLPHAIPTPALFNSSDHALSSSPFNQQTFHTESRVILHGRALVSEIDLRRLQ